MEELKSIMEKFVASGCDLDPLYKRALELTEAAEGGGLAEGKVLKDRA